MLSTVPFFRISKPSSTDTLAPTTAEELATFICVDLAWATGAASFLDKSFATIMSDFLSSAGAFIALG